MGWNWIRAHVFSFSLENYEQPNFSHFIQTLPRQQPWANAMFDIYCANAHIVLKCTIWIDGRFFVVVVVVSIRASGRNVFQLFQTNCHNNNTD